MIMVGYQAGVVASNMTLAMPILAIAFASVIALIAQSITRWRLHSYQSVAPAHDQASFRPGQSASGHSAQLGHDALTIDYISDVRYVMAVAGCAD
jgi:hypothetical protein